MLHSHAVLKVFRDAYLYEVKKLIKVINIITDTNIGGAGKMLLSFLDNYDKGKFKLIVIIPYESSLKNELVQRNVEIVEMGGIAEKSFSIKAIREFFLIFKELNPHIIHTHASVSARIAGRIFGNCKIVSTRHSVFDVAKYKTKFPMKQILGFMNNTLSDVIIAVSPAAKQNVVDFGTNPQKVSVVFNGVQKVERISDEERKKIRAKYNIAEDDFVCAIIARLEKVKGHEDILDACKMFEETDKKIKVLIAGTGAEEKHLRHKAKTLHLNNCIFTGFVKEIQEIENIMDLQLNASYGTEATSLSLLEGMSIGIPAVVSDFGGNPYVIQSEYNGTVYKKRNVQELYDAVMRIRADETIYNKMQQNAICCYDEKFTSLVMAQNIEKIYRRLVTNEK